MKRHLMSAALAALSLGAAADDGPCQSTRSQARLRREMREEIRMLRQRLNLTVAYVTHAHSEALAVSWNRRGVGVGAPTAYRWSAFRRPDDATCRAHPLSRQGACEYHVSGRFAPT